MTADVGYYTIVYVVLCYYKMAWGKPWKSIPQADCEDQEAFVAHNVYKRR